VGFISEFSYRAVGFEGYFNKICLNNLVNKICFFPNIFSFYIFCHFRSGFLVFLLVVFCSKDIELLLLVSFRVLNVLCVSIFANVQYLILIKKYLIAEYFGSDR
jgi:hypothetical protein